MGPDAILFNYSGRWLCVFGHKWHRRGRSSLSPYLFILSSLKGCCCLQCDTTTVVVSQTSLAREGRQRQSVAIWPTQCHTLTRFALLSYITNMHCIANYSDAPNSKTLVNQEYPQKSMSRQCGMRNRREQLCTVYGTSQKPLTLFHGRTGHSIHRSYYCFGPLLASEVYLPPLSSTFFCRMQCLQRAWGASNCQHWKWVRCT